jgi:enoyl-CoA hydratase/carnithine racemase
MNWEVFDGLTRAIGSIGDDVRVVVVAGEGESFSSGIDTAAFGDVQEDPSEMIRRAQAPFRALADLTVPTIASVRGHALGAGMQLALACDLRVVAADAQLGLLESKFALIPDLGGTRALTLLAGPGRAKRMIWLAERIDGAEAERLGIAEVAVEPERLEETVDDLAARLVAASPVAVREAKRLVNLAGQVDVDGGMNEEARSQKRIFASPDFAEAITAFLEGRPPRYH